MTILYPPRAQYVQYRYCVGLSCYTPETVMLTLRRSLLRGFSLPHVGTPSGRLARILSEEYDLPLMLTSRAGGGIVRVMGTNTSLHDEIADYVRAVAPVMLGAPVCVGLVGKLFRDTVVYVEGSEEKEPLRRQLCNATFTMFKRHLVAGNMQRRKGLVEAL